MKSSTADVGRLTFALNVTLDGCCDHREGIADDELLDHFTQLIGYARGSATTTSTALTAASAR